MLNRHETPLLRLPGPWGVPIDVAPSFLILVAIIVFWGGTPSVEGVIFVGLIALAILLHELGHAWGCVVQGIEVHKVVLWGGGGYCSHRIERNPVKNELIVAMGPIVNLALWALASLAVPYVPGEGAYWMWTFAYINLALFALNLIPVQPLDGGRLLHLGLLRLLSPRTAMRVAGTIGLIFAVAWIPAMLFVFLEFGLLLFFFPSIPAHWQMAKGERVA